MVLLHGYHRLVAFVRARAAVAAAVAPRLRVTQRGHGDSGKPAEGYAPPDFAHDVAAFMDAMGLESAVIVGHSMGSTVAQRFAIDYPRRTRALVLVGAAAVWDGLPAMEESEARGRHAHGSDRSERSRESSS